MKCPCKEKSVECKLPKISSAEIEDQVEPVLREMEKTGVMVDVNALEKLKVEVEGKTKSLRKSILKDLNSDINLDSPSQLAEVLFKKLKLPTEDIKRTQTGYSTAAGELYKIKNAHQAIPKILKYREYTKLISTYLTPLPKLVDENFRLHTHYSQDARTGRITSSDPNLQNIPIKGTYGEEIRATIIAPEGKVLVSADYSQIELRVIACLSGDRQMTEAFRNGVDVHKRTAGLIFHKSEKKITSDERRQAKTINFGVLYGMSPFGLSQALGIKQEEAARYIFEYFHAHQGIKEYIEETTYYVRKNGYVETLFGFRRKLENINSDNRILREADERMAVNTPIQGTAAEILKLSMIELHRKLKSETLNSKLETNSKSKIQNVRKPEIRYPLSVVCKPIGKRDTVNGKLILTVHDELVVECNKEDAKEVAKLIKEVMEGVVGLCVPISVEVGAGKNWAECKN